MLGRRRTVRFSLESVTTAPMLSSYGWASQLRAKAVTPKPNRAVYEMLGRRRTVRFSLESVHEHFMLPSYGWASELERRLSRRSITELFTRCWGEGGPFGFRSKAYVKLHAPKLRLGKPTRAKAVTPKPNRVVYEMLGRRRTVRFSLESVTTAPMLSSYGWASQFERRLSRRSLTELFTRCWGEGGPFGFRSKAYMKSL